MLTMLCGGARDGEFLEVREHASVIVIPIIEPIDFSPTTEARTPLRHITYRRVSLVYRDWFSDNPDWRWRDDIFVHPDISQRDLRTVDESVRVNITMRLWRERWRRKVLAETPEYVKAVWREDGIKCRGRNAAATKSV